MGDRLVTEYLIVGGLAAFTGMWGIPVGLLLGLGPWEVFWVALIASQLWMLIFLPIAARGTNALEKRVHIAERAQSKLGEIGKRWGEPGIGTLGVVLFGPTIALAVGLLMGFDPRRLALWSTIGHAVDFGFFTIVFSTMFRVLG